MRQAGSSRAGACLAVSCSWGLQQVQYGAACMPACASAGLRPHRDVRRQLCERSRRAGAWLLGAGWQPGRGHRQTALAREVPAGFRRAPSTSGALLHLGEPLLSARSSDQAPGNCGFTSPHFQGALHTPCTSLCHPPPLPPQGHLYTVGPPQPAFALRLEAVPDMDYDPLGAFSFEPGIAFFEPAN